MLAFQSFSAFRSSLQNESGEESASAKCSNLGLNKKEALWHKRAFKIP